MNIDKYIELSEKMVISAESYIQNNCRFESFKGSMTNEEFKIMLEESDDDKYEKLKELEERLCNAERKIKF